MERVTLQTIADRVGVSRTTVSNAFSRPDQLNADLRRRILHMAEELGYPGPHAAARTLRRGRAGVVGVLFTETLSYAFADPYAVGFLRGLAEIAEESQVGVHLIGWPSPDAADTVIRDAVVDEFCVFSLPEGHPVLDSVARTRRPFVTVDEPYLPGVPFVGIEDRAAARTLAAHLLDLGHRRLGILSGCPGVVSGLEGYLELDNSVRHRFGPMRARLAGYLDACLEAGLTRDDVPIMQTASERLNARQVAEQLLGRTPRPTAIIAASDEAAFAAMDVAAGLGLRIPEDLSVVGFDDIPGAEPAGLTTIRQPIVEKGRVAGRLLLETPGREPPPRMVLSHELVVRRSTSPPTG